MMALKEQLQDGLGNGDGGGCTGPLGADPEAHSGNQRAHYSERLLVDFAANFGGRFRIVGFRPFGIHPSEAFLFFVIGLRVDGTYAAWKYNGTDHGFFGGQYDLDLTQALELFEGRGSRATDGGQ